MVIQEAIYITHMAYAGGGGKEEKIVLSQQCLECTAVNQNSWETKLCLGLGS